MTDVTENSVFDSISDAKAAITHLATLQKRPVVVVNSRPTQFHIKCKDSSCSFEVSCFQRKDGKVYISKFVKDHECMSILTGVTAKVPVSYVANRLGHFYKKPSLMNVYAGIIQPVPIDALPFDGLLPPITRAQAGRPKKVRLRNRSELQSEDSPIVCSLCGARGHNKRTCKRRQIGERIERH